MSKKYLPGLKPCPYCGGKAVFIDKKRKGHLTIGHAIKASKSERYIRCEECHARTQSYGKIDNAINAWNFRYIYPHT